MNRTLAALVLALSALCIVDALRVGHGAAHRGPQRNLTALVDTRIGTGGNGFGIGMTAPQIQVPFGCLRVGPDTSLGLEPFRLVYDDFNGYFYANDFIECFSHTHLVGAGIGDFQNIGVMPTRALTDHTVVNANYRSRYSHDAETALPGYYAVELLDANVSAEVTAAGTHAGLHRYTFRGSQPGFVLFDICHAASVGSPSDGIAAACKEAQVASIVSEGPNGPIYIEGSVFAAGSFTGRSPSGGVRIYFKARVTATNSSGLAVPLGVSMWMNSTLLAQLDFNVTTSHSLGVGIAIAGGSSVDGVVAEVRTAISFVSQSNAAINMAAQLQNARGQWIEFDDAVQSTVNEWEEILGRVALGDVDAQPAGRLKTFYTAVYHAHQVPSTYSESNRYYLGEDFTIRTVPPGRRYLSDLSIWDIYRTQAPLLTITAPDIARDMVYSMMLMYNVTGQLPKWVLANVETGCMVGRHSAVIFADAIMKGVGELPDVQEILDAVVSGVGPQNAKLGSAGFIPFESDHRGSSLTLDYAVDAGAVYNLATFLGNTSVATAFAAAKNAYRNVWDNSSMHIMPRFLNGSFLELWPFTPYPIERHFTEGNAEQYRWYVPHDLDGLVALFPNVTYMADQLNTFFEMSEKWPFNTTLPNWAYWAGNEPDILAPFIFNFIGPEFAHLTQSWVPKLLGKYYFPEAAGVPGNDDYGTMSSWVIFSHLGFYPVASTDRYALCVPLFDSAEINVPLGRSSPWRRSTPVNNRTIVLRIVAHNRPASGQPAFLANASVNGMPLVTPIISQDMLTRFAATGAPARIDFYLSGEPSVFGRELPSRGGPRPYFPAPGSVEELPHEIEAKLRALLGANPADLLEREMASSTD